MNIAFFVPSLSLTQLSYQLIKNINEFYEKKRDTQIDIVVFYEQESNPCVNPKFMITNATDAWNYNGRLISTTLSTAHKANRFPKADHSFYVYDLEWINIPNRQYELIAEIYQKPQRLMARNDDHARIIEKCWSKPVEEVVGDFDIHKILRSVV